MEKSDRIGGAMQGLQAQRFTMSHQPGGNPLLALPPDLDAALQQPKESTKDPLGRLDLPVNTAEGLTRGLPLDLAEASRLRVYVSSLLGTDSEASFKQQVMQDLQSRSYEPALRREVLARAVRFYKAKGKGQGTGVRRRQLARGVTPEATPMKADLTKATFTLDLEKAQGPFIGPNGGKWRDAAHTQHWTPEDERKHQDSERVRTKEREESHAAVEAMGKRHKAKGSLAYVQRATGEVRHAPVVHQAGLYAVHPDLGVMGTTVASSPSGYNAHYVRKERKWSVSHAANGGSVRRGMSKEDAIVFANHMHAHAGDAGKDWKLGVMPGEGDPARPILNAAGAAFNAQRKAAREKAQDESRARYEEAREREAAREKADLEANSVPTADIASAIAGAQVTIAGTGKKQAWVAKHNKGVAFGAQIVADKTFPDRGARDFEKQLQTTDPRMVRNVVDTFVATLPAHEAGTWLMRLAQSKALGLDMRGRKGFSGTHGDNMAALAHEPFWQGVYRYGMTLQDQIKPEERAARTATARQAALARFGDTSVQTVQTTPTPITGGVDVSNMTADQFSRFAQGALDARGEPDPAERIRMERENAAEAQRFTIQAPTQEPTRTIPAKGQLDMFKSSGGPFIGPHGGKWADAKHTIPWSSVVHGSNWDGPNGRKKGVHAAFHPDFQTLQDHVSLGHLDPDLLARLHTMAKDPRQAVLVHEAGTAALDNLAHMQGEAEVNRDQVKANYLTGAPAQEAMEGSARGMKALDKMHEQLTQLVGTAAAAAKRKPPKKNQGDLFSGMAPPPAPVKPKVESAQFDMFKSVTPEAAGVLAQLLVRLQGLREAYQVLHWNARGPTSYADHLLYARLYDGLAEEVDAAAEKLVGVTGGMAAGATVGFFEPPTLEGVLAAEEDFCEEFIPEVKAILLREGGLSEGLENHIQALADAHEENVYLLRQRAVIPLAKADGGVPGEGSRGGHVIGHTSSGRPIYASLDTPHHGYGVQDHLDARTAHLEERDRHVGEGHLAQAAHHQTMADVHRMAATHLHQANTSRSAASYAPKTLEDTVASLETRKKPSTLHRVMHALVGKSETELDGMLDLLQKAEGERSGHIVGHTGSGKPIYAAHDDPHHAGFTSHDHADAAETHRLKAERAAKAGNAAQAHAHLIQERRHNTHVLNMRHGEGRAVPASTPAETPKATLADKARTLAHKVVNKTPKEGTPPAQAKDPKEAPKKATWTLTPDAPAAGKVKQGLDRFGKAEVFTLDLEKAGPYIGPRGGKWADPKHTIAWVDPAGTPQSHVPAKNPKDRARKEHGLHVLAHSGETIHLQDLGIHPATAAEHSYATSVREDKKFWERAKERSVLGSSKFHGTEKEVKSKHVGPVARGDVPLREGYAPQLLERHDGSFVTVDGHHRMAMHRMLGSNSFTAKVAPMPPALDPTHPMNRPESRVGRQLRARATKFGVAPRTVANIEQRIANGELKGTVAWHVEQARKTIQAHKATLPAFRKELEELAPSDADVKARVKDLDSAVNKVARKPHYGDASTLQDVTGGRVIVKTRVKDLDSAVNKVARRPDYLSADTFVDMTGGRIILDSITGVKQTVARIKAKYELARDPVTGKAYEDDYITNPLGDYRSHHLIIMHNGQPKELQIRTERQNTFAEWAHHVYKPETPEQEHALATHKAEIDAYSRQASEFMWLADQGKPTDPPGAPPCTPAVASSFGCMELHA